MNKIICWREVFSSFRFVYHCLETTTAQRAGPSIVIEGELKRILCRGWKEKEEEEKKLFKIVGD